MKQQNDSAIDRRGFLRALSISVGAAASPAAFGAEARADSENDDEKRKARYQADSEDVKAFYRVNHYPK